MVRLIAGIRPRTKPVDVDHLLECRDDHILRYGGGGLEASTVCGAFSFENQIGNPILPLQIQFTGRRTTTHLFDKVADESRGRLSEGRSNADPRNCRARRLRISSLFYQRLQAQLGNLTEGIQGKPQDCIDRAAATRVGDQYLAGWQENALSGMRINDRNRKSRHGRP